jgi:hypothetical protein
MPSEPVAGNHLHVHGHHGRLERPPLDSEQRRHLYDTAGHDAALSAGAEHDVRLPDPDRAVVDGVRRQQDAGVLHAGRRRQPVLRRLIGYRSVVVPYLSPSSTHVFKVVARDYFGNSAESNVLTVTTPPATEGIPPNAPTNLRLSSETSAPEIWLDWDPASDNFDPPGELLYEVFVNGTRASTGIGNIEDIVYCVDTGPNTIAVRAIDTSGNVSPFSNEIVFDC